MASGMQHHKTIIAPEDRVVVQILQHGVEVQRKVFAGQGIPVDLIDAYEAAGGAKPKAAAKSGAKPPGGGGKTIA